jgi:hypothetical protein
MDGSGLGRSFLSPKAFSRICTGELTKLAIRQSEFANRSVKLMGADPVSTQRALAEKIQQATGARINFLLIGDPNLVVLTPYNMLATDGAPTHSPLLIQKLRQCVRGVWVSKRCLRLFGTRYCHSDSLARFPSNGLCSTPYSSQTVISVLGASFRCERSTRCERFDCTRSSALAKCFRNSAGGGAVLRRAW